MIIVRETRGKCSKIHIKTMKSKLKTFFMNKKAIHKPYNGQ
jgi:hypothetical protein